MIKLSRCCNNNEGEAARYYWQGEQLVSSLCVTECPGWWPVLFMLRTMYYTGAEQSYGSDNIHRAIYLYRSSPNSLGKTLKFHWLISIYNTRHLIVNIIHFWVGKFDSKYFWDEKMSFNSTLTGFIFCGWDVNFPENEKL